MSVAIGVSVPLTTASQAARAFRRMRLRQVTNTIHSVLGGSRLRLLMILICSVVFWLGLFGLFFKGFLFLQEYIKLTNEIFVYVFSIFFLSLLIMLVFSTGILLYTGLFQSRESAYLLTTPASTDRIFAHKFVEAMAFSSWGFFLLGSPLMVAYGLAEHAPGLFYLICMLFLLAFVLIPGSLGAIGSILVAYFLPRRRKTVLAVLGVLVVVPGAFMAYQMFKTSGDLATPDGLDTLLGKLAFSQSPLLPSFWMAKGLYNAATQAWDDSLFYLMVLAAHAGLAYLTAAVVARDLYRSAYSRVQGGRSSRRRIGLYGFDAAFHRVFGFIPRTIRLLILKDIRTFRRDPAQWSQFLIFFGLLAFYFLNIRRLGYDVESPFFRNLLSFLNLSVTALILSTFTSRFIFPLLSLEGRTFWVLGLLPLRRESILWGKFAFASGISLVATETLVVLSDTMLQVGPRMIAVHMGMVAILCFGLSAISVGMGARLPDLKEEDPSKIAAGFGGTLNLLVSLVFIFLVVTALALPSLLYYHTLEVNDPARLGFADPHFRTRITVGFVVCLAFGAIATIVPLRIGIKAFQKMEF